MIRSLKLKMFAGLLLRAMAQEQAEGTTKGVSPKHPNVARRLALEPGAPELEIAERYLLQEGYISPSPADGELSFIITEMGEARIPALGRGVEQEALVEKDARGLTPEPYTVRVWEGPQPYARVGVRCGESGPLGPGLYARCWMRTSENAFLAGTRANKDNREDRLTQVV